MTTSGSKKRKRRSGEREEEEEGEDVFSGTMLEKMRNELEAKFEAKVTRLETKLKETKEELETVKKEDMPTPIWKVATDLQEVFVNHVIPKLNRNEINFFNDVN